MTDRTKITAAAVATAFLLGMFAPWDATPWAPSDPPATVCLEDQPCWDCSTMGNHQCGTDPERITR